MLSKIREVKDKISNVVNYERLYIICTYNNTGIDVDTRELVSRPIDLEYHLHDIYKKFFSDVISDLDIKIKKVGYEYVHLGSNTVFNSKMWYTVYSLIVCDTSTGLKMRYKIYVKDMGDINKFRTKG